jgi:hypothetical protein
MATSGGHNHTPCSIGEEKKIIKHFSQSEAFMAPGSHVGKPIVTKVTTLG